MSSSSPASAVSGSAPPPPPHVVEDCLGIVQLLSDGTVKRSTDYSCLPLLGDVPADMPVQWKDAVYDAAHGLRLRMYRPTAAAAGHRRTTAKLPVVVYFHGGGFCMASFELPNFHTAGLRLAAELPAVVLSADYRLAPEHRLPAAHRDGEAVLAWLRDHAQADPWLAGSADPGRVLVAGDSAGGNIAHHLAVRCGSGELPLDPLRLTGCVLLWPFFAGEERTPSEAAGDDLPMGTALFDQTWRLALPEGATRDHPAANPFGPASAPLEAVADFPPALVVDPELDVLHDRIAEYAARMAAMGKAVERVVFRGQGHGFFVFEPLGEASDQLVGIIRRFVNQLASN
ncbi:hypothetical protein ACP4OV_031184 [Aristida adscensionis]